MDNKISVEQANGARAEFELVSSHFSIDPSEMDTALCQIGALLVNYGQIEAELQLEVSRNEADKERAYAIIDNELRQMSDKGSKLTEARVKSMITLDPRYSEKVDALGRSRYNHAKIKWAMKALCEKSANLRAQAFRDRKLLEAG